MGVGAHICFGFVHGRCPGPVNLAFGSLCGLCQLRTEMEDLKITVEEQPSPDESRIVGGLCTYNAAQTGDGGYTRLTIVLRDGSRAVLGGLIGEIYWGWLHIDVLWVDESVRGQGYGAELLATAEKEGVARGCRAAYLDTFSFQAPGFYERFGYETFGILEEFPEGHTRYFLRKELPTRP